MGTKGFFDEFKEQSRIKSEIVSKYFWAWAQVMVATAKRRGEDKIAYIDLFAGPGRYGDDTRLHAAAGVGEGGPGPRLVQDAGRAVQRQESGVRALASEAIDSTPEFKQFRHPPQVANNQVGDEIVAQFEKQATDPDAVFRGSLGVQGAVTQAYQLGA